MQDFSRLWQLLSGLGEFGGGGEGVREGGGGGGEGVREGGGGDGEGVSTDRCIAGLVGEMNEERKAIVRKVRNLSCLPPSSCLCGGYLT